MSRRRRLTLVDVLAADISRSDDLAPKVELASKLHPIVESSLN